MSSLFLVWYTKELYDIETDNKNERVFLQRLGKGICFMKLFAPPTTCINMVPTGRDVNNHLTWTSHIREIGSFCEKRLIDYLQSPNIYACTNEKVKDSTTAKPRKRFITKLTLEVVLKKMTTVYTKFTDLFPPIRSDVIDNATRGDYLYHCV